MKGRIDVLEARRGKKKINQRRLRRWTIITWMSKKRWLSNKHFLNRARKLAWTVLLFCRSIFKKMMTIGMVFLSRKTHCILSWGNRHELLLFIYLLIFMPFFLQQTVAYGGEAACIIFCVLYYNKNQSECVGSNKVTSTAQFMYHATYFSKTVDTGMVQ